MAASDAFVEQLHAVFAVCDEDGVGTISIARLLQLAGEHFGSSQNSVTSAVTRLGVTGDAINFPEFCEVVATIITEDHGDDVCLDYEDEDVVDGHCSSSLKTVDKEEPQTTSTYPQIIECVDTSRLHHDHTLDLSHLVTTVRQFHRSASQFSRAPPYLKRSHSQQTGRAPPITRSHSVPTSPFYRRPSDQQACPTDVGATTSFVTASSPGQHHLSPPAVGPRMPGYDRGSPASLTDLDSAIGGSSASPDSTRKTHSGCSSMSDREENFEGNGEADDLDFDSDSARMGDELDGTLRSPPHSLTLPPSNFTRRNSWVRRSLRASPSSTQGKATAPRRWGSFRHAPKRVGGTAVASQLYRTSSFSSGRSSAADQEDMYSDASLEDDVLDLNHKVQMLQQQVGVLADNQVNADDRFSRVKQDNAAYQARLIMLEEQLREVELRADERLAEEQRRNKELIGRIEREKQLTVENYTIRLASIEKDKSLAEEECRKIKVQLEKLSKEREELADRVSEAEFSASALHLENSKMADMSRREKDDILVERDRSGKVIDELQSEINNLKMKEEQSRQRAPSVDPQVSQTQELENTLRQLRDENKILQEQVDDLQAQLLTSRLEEGRTLITSTHNNSLAAEFEAMTNEEDALIGSENIDKLRKTLKDTQEANLHLRAYIDGILLNIVENYPQLLEVKNK